MKTTIDRAGRVVIPAAIREKAGFTAGTELEVTIDEVSVRLIRRVPGPKLVRVGKRLVARPTVPPAKVPRLSLAELVAQERDRWPVCCSGGSLIWALPRSPPSGSWRPLRRDTSDGHTRLGIAAWSSTRSRPDCVKS
jgi:AbrB family looped-hinge helix DNA binding protein